MHELGLSSSKNKARKALEEFNLKNTNVLILEVNVDTDLRLRDYYHAKLDPQFIICWRGKEFNRMVGYDYKKLQAKFDE